VQYPFVLSNLMMMMIMMMIIIIIIIFNCRMGCRLVAVVIMHVHKYEIRI